MSGNKVCHILPGLMLQLCFFQEIYFFMQSTIIYSQTKKLVPVFEMKLPQCSLHGAVDKEHKVSKRFSSANVDQ